MKKLLLSYFIVFGFSYCFAQEKHELDSLKRLISDQNNDTAQIVQALNELSWHYRKVNIDSAYLLADQALKLAQKINNEKEISNAHNNFGLIHWNKGDYSKALESHFEALKIKQKNNDSLGMVISYNNIGNVYENMHNDSLAYKYYYNAYTLSRNVNDLNGQALSSSNVGLYHQKHKQMDSAIVYYNQSIKLYDQLNNEAEKSRILNNLGFLYTRLDSLDEAIDHFQKALEIRQRTGNVAGTIYSYIGIASVYDQKKKINEQINYLNKALEVALNFNMKREIHLLYNFLAEEYEKKGEYKKSYESFKLHAAYKDSLFNESKSKEIGKLEAQYEMEKKLEEEKRLAEQQEALKLKQKTRRDNLQHSGIMVFVLILFLTVFMSGKIAMKPRVAEGLIFFSFLLFFEFMLVLLDPFIDQWSGGAPAYKLILNALLAAAIFPLHAFFENTIKRKLFRAKREKVLKQQE